MAIPNLLERIDLRRLHGEPEGSGPIQRPCPAHQDSGRPNMYVYPRNAYCFRCGWHAGAFEYITLATGKSEMRDIIDEAERIANAVAADSAPDKSAPLDPAIVDFYARALAVNPNRREWLTDRYGLSQSVIEAAQLGLSFNALTIPLFDPSGHALNVRFRILPELETPGERRYWGLKGHNDFAWYLPPNFRGASSFLEILLSKYGKNSIIITEGELDALALWGLGLPAVSGVNGATSWAQIVKRAEDLAGCKVYVCYDQDEAGRNAAASLVKGLRSSGVETAAPLAWDATQYGKDASAAVAAGEGKDFFRHMALIADKKA